MPYIQNNIALTGEGRLQVAVFEDDIGKPAANASVRVSLSNPSGNAYSRANVSSKCASSIAVGSFPISNR